MDGGNVFAEVVVDEELVDVLVNQRAEIVFRKGILHFSRHIVDNPAVFHRVGEGSAVLDHDHVRALGGTVDFAFELGVDFSVLEVVGFNLHAVHFAERFHGVGNAAGVAVNDEGAFFGQRLFNQFVMGEGFALGHDFGHIGQRGDGGEQHAQRHNQSKQFLHKKILLLLRKFIVQPKKTPAKDSQLRQRPQTAVRVAQIGRHVGGGFGSVRLEARFEMIIFRAVRFQAAHQRREINFALAGEQMLVAQARTVIIVQMHRRHPFAKTRERVGPRPA